MKSLNPNSFLFWWRAARPYKNPYLVLIDRNALVNRIANGDLTLQFILDLEEGTYIHGTDGMLQWVILEDTMATILSLQFDDLCRATFPLKMAKDTIDKTILRGHRESAFTIISLCFSIDDNMRTIDEALQLMGRSKTRNLSIIERFKSH